MYFVCNLYQANKTNKYGLLKIFQHCLELQIQYPYAPLRSLCEEVISE